MTNNPTMHEYAARNVAEALKRGAAHEVRPAVRGEQGRAEGPVVPGPHSHPGRAGPCLHHLLPLSWLLLLSPEAQVGGLWCGVVCAQPTNTARP